MGLKLTRVKPGEYVDEQQGVLISQVSGGWQLVVHGSWVTTLPSKKACVTAFQVHDRKPKDRTESAELQVKNRPRLTPGKRLKIEGIRGDCTFVRYVRKDDGAEWIDVETSRGFSRTVRPEKIQTVRRK